jgi:ABC-type glycerol-3-phosphate transport system permease component
MVIAITLFPIAWILLTSIKTPREAFASPPVWFFTPTLESYRVAFSVTPLAKYFINTIVIATGTASFALVFGCFGAYAVARFDFVGRTFIRSWVLGTQVVPPVVVLIPLFIMFFKLGLIGTYPALILTNTAFLLPFSIWMMSGFFADLPRDLEDSAVVDGCTRMQAFYRIVLPLSSPGLAAVWILCLIFSWNSFIIPLAIADEATKTPPLAIQGFRTDKGIMWGPACAAGFVTIMPVLVFALLVQKYIVSGLTRGAVKG